MVRYCLCAGACTRSHNRPEVHCAAGASSELFNREKTHLTQQMRATQETAYSIPFPFFSGYLCIICNTNEPLLFEKVCLHKQLTPSG